MCFTQHSPAVLRADKRKPAAYWSPVLGRSFIYSCKTVTTRLLKLRFSSFACSSILRFNSLGMVIFVLMFDSAIAI